MPLNLKGRHFLKLEDFSTREICYLIQLSKDFKKLKRTHTPHRILEGHNIVLLFEKNSTRTRCSFEVASFDLGMGVTYLDSQSSQMFRKESIADTAKVLSRLYDGIEYRGFSHDTVEELALNSEVPVWNGLTDEFHPTQMIADMMTIEEEFGKLKGLKLTFFGDCRNNVSKSLMMACAKLGIHYTACGPKTLWPSRDWVAKCSDIAQENQCTVQLTEDIDEGARNCDVLYTDVWVSMGEDKSLWENRVRLLRPYQINDQMFEFANENAIFMHCLPSFHDRNTEIGEHIYQEFGIPEMEVSDSVFKGAQSRVFEQAENRMHSIKAIIVATLK